MGGVPDVLVGSVGASDARELGAAGTAGMGGAPDVLVGSIGATDAGGQGAAGAAGAGGAADALSTSGGASAAGLPDSANAGGVAGAVGAAGVGAVAGAVGAGRVVGVGGVGAEASGGAAEAGVGGASAAGDVRGVGERAGEQAAEDVGDAVGELSGRGVGERVAGQSGDEFAGRVGGQGDGAGALGGVMSGSAGVVATAGAASTAGGADGSAGGSGRWGDEWQEFGERLGELTEVRVRHPERVAEGWLQRRTRALVGDDGRLLIVAADHPARGALGVRGDRMAMGSRADLIARLMIALQRPGVDGVLATPDVLEDLLLLGALEGKVVIGSMNRGGLQGAAFELDDRFTAYRTADEIAARRLDGGKMLTRIDLDDPGTVATLESSAAAVTGLAEHKLMAMVEPFWSTRGEDGRVTNLLDPDSVIKSIQIASGLGATSAYTWLKLPVVDELDRVMEATTMPTLLLGGDPTAAPEATYASWGKALELPSVRGLVVGRALLFPPDGDVAAAVDQAAALVHGDTV